MVSTTMRAGEFIKNGDTPDITISEQPVPTLGENEALIKVYAAGVNRPDLAQMAGRYNPPPGVTQIPGLEIAGEIIEINGESDFSVGDKICALVSGGGYAEYCAVPLPQCLPLPDDYDYTHAAAIPETFFTVWVNLFHHGRLQEGETVLIHGGSSGIGTTAIQIAKAFGARVAITAGSDEKCQACRDIGADIAINYKTEDFVETLQEDGVDVILDMVGGDYIPRNIKILKDKGRHVSIAGQRGWTAEMPIFDVMRKRLVLTGSTLRPRTVEEKAVIAKDLYEKVWPLLNNKSISPILHKTFALDDVKDAYQLLESSKHIGKIVLIIRT